MFTVLLRSIEKFISIIFANNIKQIFVNSNWIYVKFIATLKAVGADFESNG